MTENGQMPFDLRRWRLGQSWIASASSSPLLSLPPESCGVLARNFHFVISLTSSSSSDMKSWFCLLFNHLVNLFVHLISFMSCTAPTLMLISGLKWPKIHCPRWNSEMLWYTRCVARDVSQCALRKSTGIAQRKAIFSSLPVPPFGVETDNDDVCYANTAKCYGLSFLHIKWDTS